MIPLSVLIATACQPSSEDPFMESGDWFKAMSEYYDAVENGEPAQDVGSLRMVKRVGIRMHPDFTWQVAVKGEQTVLTAALQILTTPNLQVLVSDLTLWGVGDDDGEFVADIDDDLVIQDHVNSCSLYKLDDTLIAGPESPNASGRLLFTGPGLRVDTRKTVLLECDLANVDVASLDPDVFAWQIQSEADIVVEDAVTANRLTGGSLLIGDEFDSGVNMDVHDEVAVLQHGELTCAIAGSIPRPSIILGNSSNVPVSTFRCSSQYEDFYIENLSLANCLTGQMDLDGDCADPGEVPGSDAVAADVQLRYEDANQIPRASRSFLWSNMATFQNLGAFVPEDGTAELEVEIDSNTVGPMGAQSGDEIQLNLDATGTRFRAIGVDSGEVVYLNWYVTAHPHVIRKTKPTLSLSAGSPWGGGFVPGMLEVFRFNVSADTRGDVPLDLVTFKVTTSDDAYDGLGNGWSVCGNGVDPVFADDAKWGIYNVQDLSTELPAVWEFRTYDQLLCEPTVVDKVRYATATVLGEIVPAGATEAYVVRVNTMGADPAADDYFRLDIPDELEMINNGIIGRQVESILWDDDGEAFDIDGMYIKNLPVTGGTLVF